MRVRSDIPNFLSPVVWVVYSRTTGTIPWVTNTTASSGLKQLAEGGVTAPLLAELEAMKAVGGITSYGVVTSTEQLTSSTTFGQQFTFKVEATQHDSLMFATMLVRSNDRFVAPLEPGMPFFIGMKPNYGDQKDFTLFDAGTEVNQQYFANLGLGYMSQQPGSGQGLASRPENGTILPVADYEFSPIALNNDTYPNPQDFMQITFSPAMEVLLADQTRAQRGNDVLVEFTLEQGQNLGNEIHVQFPEGYTFHEGGLTTSNITWFGLQRYISRNSGRGPHHGASHHGTLDLFDDPSYDQPIHTVVNEETRVVQVRWAEGIQLNPLYTQEIYLTIHNVRPPNNCEPKSFSATTHQCHTADLHGQGTVLVRRCSAALYSISSVQSYSAVPSHCSMCNACVFMYEDLPTDSMIFECEQDGKKFIRQRPTGFPHFSQYFDHGTIYDKRCQIIGSG